ncbi:MAG: amidohydrolase family protein, partial [Promethearchaeota archaeon]
MFDTLIVNGKIYTMEKEDELFSSMAIKDGKIARLYEQNPKNPKKIAKQIINAKQKAILPGLIDSHVHFMTTVISKEIGIPISEMINGKLEPSTLDGIRIKAQKFAKMMNPQQPLLFRGIILPSIKEGHLPYKEQIDEWFPDRDVIFMTIDGHACSLSTRGLKSMKIDPEGHNGILTEDMEEFDMDKIMTLLRSGINFGTILSGLKKTINAAIKYGIVGIHCLDGFQENAKKDITLRFMQLFGGKIPLYLREYPQVRDVSQFSFLVKKMRKPRVGGCGAWEMDGAVGAKTAAFYDPYIGDADNT